MSAVSFRCPFCHAGVAPSSEPARACGACFAPHHAECWKEHGRCSACGEGAALPGRRRVGRGALVAAGLAATLGVAVLLGVAADRALVAEPRSEYEHRCRALALLEKRDLDGARFELSRALEVDRSSAMSWALRGSVRLAQGETRAALRDLDEALRLAPRFEWAREQRARALERM